MYYKRRTGVIAKPALDAFMARPRKDWSFYKRLTAAQVEERMAKLPIRPPIWKKLNPVQKRCLVLGAHRKRFLFFNDTGTGKTLLCLALARYFRKAGTARRALILVPSRVNADEWELEIQKHCPSTKYLILRGSSEEKWEALNGTKASIVVGTYMGTAHMVCDLKKPKRSKKHVMKPNRTRLRRFAEMFGGLYMDECTWVKNRDALPFRICRQVSKRAAVTFGLAAMPHGRDPVDLWGQAFLVDWGKTLGENLGLFRAAFFTAKQGNWATEWSFNKRKDKLLHQFLANVAITFDADEADLPAVVPIKLRSLLPEDAEAYYKKATEAIIAAKGDYTAMKNAFTKMRQISSGFIGYRDDELGKKASYEFPEKPKLESMVDYISRIPAPHKIIIFHDFTFSGDLIAKELKKLKLKYVRVDGRTKDTKAARVDFERDPNARALGAR